MLILPRLFSEPLPNIRKPFINLKGVNIEAIPFREVLKVAGHRFNPPSPQANTHQFEGEWYQCREAVKNALDTIGEPCDQGTKDYTITDSYCLSRGIGVDITSEKMYCPEFIFKTISALYSVTEEYEVFADSTFETDGVFTYIIIHPREVLVCAPRSVQRLLGL